MSKYSGKCDFGDSWDIFEEEILKRKIFIGDNIVPLKIESYKDALPYFPRIVSIMVCGNGDGIVRLTERSYVDTREEEHLNYVLDEYKRYYKKCKRKHRQYDPDEAVKKLCYFADDIEIHKSIAKEVADRGSKATVPNNVHMPIQDYYRKSLYDDMLKAGYSQMDATLWCFGWLRFYNRDLPDGIYDYEKGEFND